MKRLSLKTQLIVVTILTALLLIGSVVADRIVFQAVEPSAKLYFTPPTQNLAPQDRFAFEVNLSLGQPTVVSAIELRGVVTEEFLELTDFQPSDNWQTVVATNDLGEIFWLLTPSPEYGAARLISGSERLGLIRGQAKTNGSVSLILNPTESRVVAVTSEGVTNVLESLQSVSFVIGAVSAPAEIESEPIDLERTPFSQTQKILSSQVVAGTTVAAVLIQLKYRGNLRLEYGSTRNLGQRLDFTASAASFSTSIFGLVAGETYYYRVSALSEDRNELIAGPILSFTTGQIGQGPIDPERSELFTFPAVTNTTGQVIVVARNQDGEIVESIVPLEVDRNLFKLGNAELIGGLQIRTIESLQPISQTALVTSPFLLEDVDSLFFDRNFVEPTLPELEQPDRLTMTRQLELFVLILVLLSLGLIIGLRRLARHR